MSEDFGGGDEIAFERIGAAGVVTLTRPKALNALTHGMATALHAALRAWEQDASVRHVVVRAEGRAFCAGGDIADIYRAGLAGRPSYGFFADEYRLNAYVARYSKPYTSLIDGIVMGGGVGISVHGSHRVMTDKAVFAMPEVGIGFFPDVGGSHFLPRLPRRYGYYLALSGERIRWGDALRAGIATHAVASDALPDLFEALTRSEDPSGVLAGLGGPPAPETGDDVLDAIEANFSAGDLASVLDGLERAAGAGDGFCEATLRTMRTRSPTSLHVAMRQLQEGGGLSMDDCMRMEYRILTRMLQGHDFYEGIRAAVIDRDGSPRWEPARLADVSAEAVAAYFAPLGRHELSLP